MSILGQVLKDAFASAFRRAPAEAAKAHPVEPAKATHVGTAATQRPPQAGMKVVILNWNRGENNPFTVFNKTITQYLHACGKNVDVLEITETDWVGRLAKLVPGGVEFALTWQGLGSGAAVAATRVSIWDHFKIPLICIHGDHPSHMPLNHELESRYCFHLYTNADFARYSNRHFRKTRSASVIDIPQLHREARLPGRAGDYFVLAKNINDPTATESSWRQQLSKHAFDAFMRAAETLKTRLANEEYVEIHDVLDELIVQHGLEWLTPAANAAAYHDYHSQLDHYMRSYKTVSVLTSLRDFPIHVYGRGWERFAQSAPASHVFESGRNMADSQDLYYTRFGLIDVSPSKTLHDRTRRAMANDGAFLSSANLEDSFDDIGRFDRLFFSFRKQDLANKCAAVLRDPEAHLAAAQQFGRTYNERFHFRHFVNRIDQLAKMASVL